MPPQNVPLWHIDYFKLKALEKWQVKEKHSNLPSFLYKQEMKFSCDRYPLYTRGKVTFLSRISWDWENSIQKFVKIILTFL